MSLVALYPETSLFERKLHDLGYLQVAGVDEVGRGPLAGPVYACALVLPQGELPVGIKDSKKISEKKREKLAQELMLISRYGIGVADAETIDEINILEATKLAMRRALDAIERVADYVLIDALELPDLKIPQHSLVKGDQVSVSIAAASIVAKYARDELMRQYDKQYPGYDFARNKGYGTASHREAILALGPRPIHRRSFLSRLLEP